LCSDAVMLGSRLHRAEWVNGHDTRRLPVEHLQHRTRGLAPFHGFEFALYAVPPFPEAGLILDRFADHPIGIGGISRVNVAGKRAARGHVLWCVTRQDLFAPALVLAGLAPDRVIYVEAGDEKAVLSCFEEALRHRKLGAVVAEVASLSMTASRRLQIAAEGPGVIGLALGPPSRRS
jgi:hypothetical protein